MVREGMCARAGRHQSSPVGAGVCGDPSASGVAPTHPSVGTSSRIPLYSHSFVYPRPPPTCCPRPTATGVGFGGRAYCYRRVTLGPRTLNQIEEKHQQFQKKPHPIPPHNFYTPFCPNFCPFRLRRTVKPVSRQGLLTCKAFPPSLYPSEDPTGDEARMHGCFPRFQTHRNHEHPEQLLPFDPFPYSHFPDSLAPNPDPRCHSMNASKKNRTPRKYRTDLKNWSAHHALGVGCFFCRSTL